MAENNITADEMLQEVNNAIYAILVGGQSYKIGSRSLTRANITELKKLKNELEAKIAQSDSSLIDDCYVAIFDGR
jgi:hypothetical protein